MRVKLVREKEEKIKLQTYINNRIRNAHMKTY